MDQPRSLAAVIGFAGTQMRGKSVVTYDLGLAMATCAECGDSVNVLDWTGEVANQLLGRIKNKLLAHDVSIDLRTPVALSGEKLDSTIVDSTNVRRFACAIQPPFAPCISTTNSLSTLFLGSSTRAISAIRQEGEWLLVLSSPVALARWWRL